MSKIRRILRMSVHAFGLPIPKEKGGRRCALSEDVNE